MEYQAVLEGKMGTQGGGHGRINKCIVNPGNINAIAKPVDHREYSSYLDIMKTPLAPYVCTFYGKHNLDGTDMIVIQDLTSGMNSPCVADLKVGKRHYDLTANPEKIKGLIEKSINSTTPTLGVRATDIHIRKTGKADIVHERKENLKLSIDGFSDVVHEFLPGSRLNDFHEQIVKIRDAFSETIHKFPGFRVYASSVLLTYDGDNDNGPLNVKLIDFAHMYLDISADGGDLNDRTLDDGVLDGLNSLCEITSH